MPKIAIKSKLAALKSAMRFPPQEERAFQQEYYLRRRIAIMASVWIMAAFWLPIALYCLRNSETPLFVVYSDALVYGLLIAGTFHPKFARFWQPVLTATTVFLLALPIVTTHSEDTYNILPVYIYPLLIILRIHRLLFRWTVLQVLGVTLAFAYALGFAEPGKWDWSYSSLGFCLCIGIGLIPLLASLWSELKARAKYLQPHLPPEQTEGMLLNLRRAIGGMGSMLATLKSALRFSPEDERVFQQEYYLKRHAGIIASIWIMATLWLLSALVSLLLGTTPLFVLFTTGTVSVLLLWCAFRPKFAEVWQPALTATTVFLLAFPIAITHGNDLYTSISLLIYPLLIVFRIHHLQFRWTALQLLGPTVVFTYTWGALDPHKWDWGGAIFGFLLCITVGLFPLLNALKSELSERAEFSQKALLASERDAEREKREQSEKMLHILSQAIGGIVHDLGNPLTAVQGGAETLLYFVKQGKPDKEMVQEFATMITDGAQMLNYLRLSLMEQTRVLEGKPTPIEPSPTSIHHMVKAGAHYQKPRFSAGRTISFEGEDLEVCVDEMRFITVFMNLIGNALKYSDGEVRITWSQQTEHILIAVQDQGMGSKGITQTQAEKLFVPFGRLDTHAQIEGTGLGLLSVRKIAEAHDGEVYIEGRTDGTLETPAFSTAQNTYTTILEADFLTAFVTACPLKVLSHREQVSEIV